MQNSLYPIQMVLDGGSFDLTQYIKMTKFLPFLLIVVVVIGAFTYLPVKRRILYALHLSGDTTLSCCNEADVAKSNGNFDESANLAFFNGEEVDYPKTSLAENISHQLAGSAVLGTKNTAGEDKWIEVSLDEQLVRAWEGNKVVKEFPISSGLWGRTPKGDFSIWYKTRYQRMTGGKKELGTFYDLPNVPNNMFFYKGYALHGAYWHNNFGHPMSHGCVNEPLANAADIFEWAGPVVPEGQNAVRATEDNPGTRVFVH
ncbi:hypothetical protein A2631_03870 [Candidatus Daviesbacteria bacterium RIFCSPHIGHO2_01_FULL_44_29]|uniref:L,D-TPase catalytic domain-containing protein n=1 Tax=Candidatus Daviesbacteria bacterium RIFCSPHIGHO2_02_FULL_43_12 TaxID=1797776 RepID=A0A1F5KGC9_9BACT|nr:MAG: hypothetical protein A2631_03870 [Candidatus Daviesbacteria bacterium RIFCSPHIGHO2_01_FULL_44_29]OGE39870.1 MAG: hypothetical protein A3D25_03600 [Candidatus Daviesbacteria bacterium RIFCSPHIGHO2_02_FULL_43_12]OGE70449.1 MAG: hypothetical protein A3B55_01970 [Candidatus Daviesbacteria bacterium RIFCSPLOWO2_01_FULL_43_15]